MPSVQVHYDGWLALPEAVRRKLGVGTGERLEVELVDGTVVLRPARRADAAGRAGPEPATAERPVEAGPQPTSVTASAPVVKRGAGRPRKASADAALLPNPKACGRRESVVAAETRPA